MKVTTTVTVEIKGQKHELTQAEAQELLGALTAALGSTPSSPWVSPFVPPYHVGNHPPTLPSVLPWHVVCGQQGATQ